VQRQLVEKALGGDIESFGELCTYYYSPMVAIAYSVLTDHQLAEDAAQEAFARAMVNLGKLRKPGRFATWLARICRNTAVDMVRAKAKEANCEDLSRHSAAETKDADGEAVRAAIGELARADRELIVLRYFNSLSYEQISEVLGISKAAVNGRRTRAKQKLAGHLKQQGVWES